MLLRRGSLGATQDSAEDPAAMFSEQPAEIPLSGASPERGALRSREFSAVLPELPESPTGGRGLPSRGSPTN